MKWFIRKYFLAKGNGNPALESQNFCLNSNIDNITTAVIRSYIDLIEDYGPTLLRARNLW